MEAAHVLVSLELVGGTNPNCASLYLGDLASRPGHPLLPTRLSPQRWGSNSSTVQKVQGTWDRSGPGTVLHIKQI